MEFKLSQGPWKRIFEGTFQGFKVELHSNPDELMLVLIFDKEEGKVKGAVAELYSPFYVEGQIEGFVESLPKKVLLLSQHEKDKTVKYLLVGSGTDYFDWKETQFIEGIDKLLSELQKDAKTVVSYASAYEIEMKPLGDASEAVKSSFFSQPLLVSGMATVLPESKMKSLSKAGHEGEMLLGLDKDQRLVKEPISLFKRTVVSNGNPAYRKQLIHVLVEGFLLSNIASTAFDFEKDFKGLSAPNENLDELKKANMTIDPIGFPTQHLKAKSSVKVDLNLLNVRGLTELFGLGEEDLNVLLENVFKKGKIESIDDVTALIRAEKPTQEINQYQINKAVRFMNLVKMRYPELFGSANDIESISNVWVRGLGKIGIIDSQELDLNARLLLVHNLLKGILQYYKKKEVVGNQAVVFIPKADSLIGKDSDLLLSKDIESILLEFEKYGISFVLESEHLRDFNDEFSGKLTAELNLVSGLDAAISFKGRKQYRLAVRPTLSKPVEESE